MSALGFNVTFDEVQGYDWQSVPAPLEERDRKHDRASAHFFPKAAALREAGDELGERVFRFLGAVTSLFPSFESKETPFRPQIIDGTRRSAALEDFTQVDGAVLAQLAAVTTDAEMKARFADVAAVLKFDHALVREATYAYLATARLRENCEKWPNFIRDVERAAQLAWKLGRKQQPFLDAMQYVEELVAKFSPHDAGLCCSRLMELMQEFGHGDAATHAKISETLAERAEGNNNPLFARSYWELAAEWYRRNEQKAESQRCAIRAAETHVLDGEGATGRPPSSYMASAGHLTQAVGALRRANAPKERVEEVHRLLLERQKHVHEEMGTFGSQVEIGPLQEQAKKLVEGCAFRDAIFRLTTGVSPIDVKAHRERTEKNAKENPLSAIISASMVDREGRVVGHKPSMFTSDRAQYEAALWAEMMHDATMIDWPFRLQTFIGPCRLQIWREHQPRIRDLRFLVADHPFVPPGHEHSFARGFHAGFEGDWHAVAYFLAPQVENSIRYVLENRGVITSKLDDKLIQEVRSLDKLLLMPETTEAFGEEHVFELRGILTEEFGSNLRNRIAHGLATDGDCYGPATEHLWWLLLRLCVIPVLPKVEAGPASDISAGDKSAAP